MQIGLRQKLENCKTLPSLPALAVHLLRLCQRENLDIADVARAIGSDAALAARVVSLLNTPLFGMRQEVGTVSHALVLLGVNAVRTITLSFALVGEMRAHERPGLDHRTYWKRALFAAAVAQDLARKLGARPSEEAFLAALLQDIGKIALAHAVPDQYAELLAEAKGEHDALIAVEKRALGCDHAEVGRWLMAQWRFTESVRAAIGSSHEPTGWQRGADPSTDAIVKVVAASGVIADIWVSDQVEEAARRAQTRARELLALGDDRMLPLIQRLTKTVAEVAPLFGVFVGEASELQQVVDRAEYGLTHGCGIMSMPSPIHATVTALPTRTDVDGMTGLASRARFEEYLAQQFELAQQEGKALSVVCCDLDHLEMINQAFGWAAGDRALGALGTALGERLRHRDLAARLGNAEFGLILVDTHSVGAGIVAERVRKRVEDGQHEIGIGDPVRMTISVGYVTLDATLAFETPADLLRAAGEALAQAKAAGRNRATKFTNWHIAA